MPNHEINIDVLGCSIPISADEEPEYLQNLLETYKQKLNEIRNSTGLKDPLKIAILTGFLLCDECGKNQQSQSTQNKARQPYTETKNDKGFSHDETGEAEKITLNLISKLGDLLGMEEPAAAENRKDEKIYKLQNTIKNYSWGSPDWIPELLGIENHERIPYAEMWMGVHPEGPSGITAEESDGANGQGMLSELIAQDQKFFMGNTEFETLPFLLKLLAVEKPLSLKAHPGPVQAREGWDRENREGMPLDSTLRNYRDINHKPEILSALTPFTLMAGFRHPLEIKTMLSLFLDNASRDLKAAAFPLLNILDERQQPIKKFLNMLFALPGDIKTNLCAYARQKADDEWHLIRSFSDLYPADPAILSPIFLNTIQLNPGEAVFLPAGTLHSFVHGLGIELTANSNNIIRGGLTQKHTDLNELFRILNYDPFKPEIHYGSIVNGKDGFFKFDTQCSDFSLSVIKGGELDYPETGPSIILVTEGELMVSGNETLVILQKGESAFIPANEGGFHLSGDFTLYAAGPGQG